MTTDETSYGLCMIRQTRSFERNAEIEVSVVQMKDGQPAVYGVGCSAGFYAYDGYIFDCLSIRGHLYRSCEQDAQGKPILELIGDDPAFYSIYKLESRDAERALKTLKALERMFRKCREKVPNGHLTPRAKVSLLAGFVNAKYVAWIDRTAHPKTDWQYMSVEAALDLYDREIERMKQEWTDPYARYAAA